MGLRCILVLGEVWGSHEVGLWKYIPRGLGLFGMSSNMMSGVVIELDFGMICGLCLPRVAFFSWCVS